MTYKMTLAGLAFAAVAAIGIAGCDDGRRHDRVVAVPADRAYYDNGYYHDNDGYYYRQRHVDSDRGRFGYHIQRDYDHHGGSRDGSRDVDRGGGHHR